MDTSIDMVIPIVTIIPLDEEAFSTTILDYFRKHYPDSDEVRIQRLAQLSADVIRIMDISAYSEGKHHWFAEQWIMDRLREFGRVHEGETEKDLRVAIGIALNLGRVKCREFDNYGKKVDKFVYNIYFKLSNPEPVDQPAQPQYMNPF